MDKIFVVRAKTQMSAFDRISKLLCCNVRKNY